MPGPHPSRAALPTACCRCRYSAVIGTRLPGPGAIHLSQSLKFRRPVKIGDAVVATVTISALDERRGHVTFVTTCQVDGKTVVEGEAVIMAPRRSTTEGR